MHYPGLNPLNGSPRLTRANTRAAGRRAQDRRTRWLNDLAEKVHRLEDQIGDVERLMGDVLWDPPM